MKNEIYLVRLSDHFRLLWNANQDMAHVPGTILRAFVSCEEARQFVHVPPTDWNPFAYYNLEYYVTEVGGIIVMDYWDEDEEGRSEDHEHEIPLSEFVALCQNLGVTPPDLAAHSRLWNPEWEKKWDKSRAEWEETAKEKLHQWWENEKNALSDTQKAAIWKRLHPHPCEIVTVPLAQTAEETEETEAD